VEEVEEVLGRDYFFAEDQGGRIMAVDAEGNMSTPLPSPTLAQEDSAPPPAPPAPEDPVPATAGGGPGDPRDDDEYEVEDYIQYDEYYRGGMWAASDAEEEPLELSEDPGASDGGHKDPADHPSPPAAALVLPKLQTEKAIHYIDEAEGPFPRMLWEAIQIIGTTRGHALKLTALRTPASRRSGVCQL